jgi:chitinase
VLTHVTVAKDKYTHLYFSFAFIDETSYKIKPAAEADASLMKDFTALKSSKLQTWIAVGGYDFSDKGKTHTTWSDMCSTQAGRAAFIQSTISFMDEYGFQGLVSLFYGQTTTRNNAD